MNGIDSICRNGSGGHLRAARAVQTCLREYEPSWRVEVVDALKCVGSLLDKTCCDGYRFLATKTPKVFGQLYRATNEESVLNTLMTHFSGLLGPAPAAHASGTGAGSDPIHPPLCHGDDLPFKGKGVGAGAAESA